ncbi:hypothetical protein PR202_ga09019 [Eleusine coracana subsp. coracana]|uniref:VWA-Hint protein Vwaint domain-containing protein n=1 Tax=Eleusine coracana subsp. coracana TaxID=191504 RepID=A0AAV5C225_ELECO|nr:hypothetical protein PR202_ga09019 [Eleusine coracana subsp. coracana]
MSDDGKASARAAVESLRATDSTNIGAGLQVAAQVLDDRRHKNASGRYESNVDADGRAASVDVGELYAEEERRFLLLLDVPVAAAGDGHAQQQDGDVTRLIKASCTYKDAAAVRRPVAVAAAADAEPSMEVARERFRVEAAEDIASARAAAEQGQHAEAARILDRRREASVAAGLSGDARCAALAEELRELSARVADRREYEHTGRAFMLAGISSHAQQRAATVQLTGSAAPGGPRFGAAAALGNSSAGSMPAFGTMAPFGATAAGSGRSSSSPFGDQPLGFVGASTPTFGSAAPAFGATSSSGLFGAAASPQNSLIFSQPGAAAPCFTFGYATPAMQSTVDSSRKTREQQQSEPAAETKGDTGTFWR